MGRELLFAGGYPSPYKNDEDELKAVDLKDWSPSTVDFQATAASSGGGTAVSSLADVLKFLSGKPDGSVTELGIIAHANSTVFGLGGSIVAPTLSASGDVTFDNAKLIDSSSLSNSASAIAAVKTKFAPNARIILYGCHAGLADSLLAAMAKTFGVCVYGFSTDVISGFTTVGRPPRIVDRGHVFIDSKGLLASGIGPPVGQWPKDVHKLSPDKKSPGCADIP